MKLRIYGLSMDDRNRPGRSLRGSVAPAGQSRINYATTICLTCFFQVEHWIFFIALQYIPTHLLAFHGKLFLVPNFYLQFKPVTEPTQQNRLISSFATLSLLTYLLSGLNSLNFPAFPFLVTFHPAAVIHFLLLWALHVLVRVCVSLKQLSPAWQPDSAGNYLCIF